MGGVAAKAEMVQTHTRPLVRKSLRTRHRSTTPKHLKIPANVPEEAESKSAALRVSRAFNGAPAALPVQLPPPPPPKLEPLRPMAIEIDTDTETEVGQALEEADRDGMKTVDTPPSFTDFSSFIDVSMMDEDYDNGSVTEVGSENYNNIQSTEDLYGWEAVLNQQLKCGINNPECCHCDNFEFHGANGSKRGLLHRVFSSGRRSS